MLKELKKKGVVEGITVCLISEAIIVNGDSTNGYFTYGILK